MEVVKTAVKRDAVGEVGKEGKEVRVLLEVKLNRIPVARFE